MKKYYAAIFLSALAGTASFFVMPRLVELFPKVRSTQTIGMVGRFTLEDIPLSVQKKISLGLTTLTPDGRPAPALARSWTVSGDGKVYEFELDTEYLWHDGVKLTSRDVDYRFQGVTTETVRPDWVTIKLKEPFSPLPVVLSRPIFRSANHKLLGLGSYKMAKIGRNGPTIESLVLEPVDVNNDLPKLRYIFYPTQTLALAAFKLGLVNLVEDLPEKTEVANWPRVRVQANVRYDRYVGLFFGWEDQRLSGNAGKNLRLALAYAIDKSRWDNRALGPISPTSWVYNPDLKTFDQDTLKAKQILEKIENPVGKVTISSTADNFWVAEDIKSDWKAVGVDAEVVATADLSSKFSALLITQVVPTDPDQYNLWHSTQGTNFSRFRNDRIDKLLEDGRKTSEAKQRATIYSDFQRFLVEDLPVVFLFHPTTYTVSR